MDPLVDKIMMAAAFISLVPLKAVSSMGSTNSGSARFFNHGFAPDGRVPRAEFFQQNGWAKQKTSWQIITVIFFLALLSMAELRYADDEIDMVGARLDEAGPLLVWITVALTIYSALGFTWRNRELNFARPIAANENRRESLRAQNVSRNIFVLNMCIFHGFGQAHNRSEQFTISSSMEHRLSKLVKSITPL